MRNRREVLALGVALWLWAPTGTVAAERMVMRMGDGAIVIIDTAEDKVVARIKDISSAQGLATTLDGRYVIAGGRLARPAVSLSASPSEKEHAAHHASGAGAAVGTAVQGAKSSDAVTVLSQPDGRIVGAIDIPGAVRHIAVSPKGRLAVATHPDSAAISVIDLRLERVIETVPTGFGASGAVFGPDGILVYVSNAGDATVSAVDTDVWAVIWSTNVGKAPEHMALSRRGLTLYVANVADGTVSVVSTVAQQTVDTLQIAKRVHGIDIADNHLELFVAATEENRLIVFDLASRKRRFLQLTPAPYHVAVVRGQGKVYVSSAKVAKIWVIDRVSLKVLREIE